jgi:hypothetical protein
VLKHGLRPSSLVLLLPLVGRVGGANDAGLWGISI